MSVTYHTNIPFGAAVSTANVNAPLGQLDQALVDFANGDKLFTELVFAAASTIPIISDTLLTSQAVHIVAAETGTADNLSTITAVNDKILYLKGQMGHTITIKNGVGNIYSATGADVTLSGNIVVHLICIGSNWAVIGASGGGSTYSLTLSDILLTQVFS